MTIITVVSQKGGVGKSTVATNLATQFALSGKDVCLVDADFQRTTARWHKDREEAGHQPSVPCVEKLGLIHSTLVELDEKYEIVVVDVAGRDSQELRTGLTAADLALVVSRPSQADLDTLAHLVATIEEGKSLNPDLDVRGLLTQVSTNPSVTELEEALEYLHDFPLVSPLETVLYDRKAYRDVLGEGLSVVEWDNPKARAEIQELAGELMA